MGFNSWFKGLNSFCNQHDVPALVFALTNVKPHIPCLPSRYVECFQTLVLCLYIDMVVGFPCYIFLSVRPYRSSHQNTNSQTCRKNAVTGLFLIVSVSLSLVVYIGALLSMWCSQNWI